jgi:hypothetical protein
MGKIRFIEERRLLDNCLVQIGDERDFGDEENAAFVLNGVAEFVEPPEGKEVINHG